MKWKLCCTAHINCTFLCLKEKFSDVIIWTVSFYQVKSAKSWVLLEESLSFLGNLLYFLTLSYFGLEFSLKCPKKAWCTCIWKLGEKVPEKKTQWPNPRRNCPRRNCRRRKNILPSILAGTFKMEFLSTVGLTKECKSKCWQELHFQFFHLNWNRNVQRPHCVVWIFSLVSGAIEEEPNRDILETSMSILLSSK